MLAFSRAFSVHSVGNIIWVSGLRVDEHMREEAESCSQVGVRERRRGAGARRSAVNAITISALTKENER